MKKLKWVAALPLCFALSGCAAAVVGGVAAGGAITYIAVKRKGQTDPFQDLSLSSKVHKTIKAINPLLVEQLSYLIRNNRILIAGPVKSPEEHLSLITALWQIDGIKDVYDCVHVGKLEDHSTKDAFLHTNVKSLLMTRRGISSANYDVMVLNGAIYILGHADTVQEKRKVETLMKNAYRARKVTLAISLGPRV